MIGSQLLAKTTCTVWSRGAVYRCFSGQRPRRGSWASLSDSQRAAWESLGWDKDRWEGLRSPPESSFKQWNKLSSSEQAAAMHGLGYTKNDWEASMLNMTSNELSTVSEENKNVQKQHKSVSVDLNAIGSKDPAAPTKHNDKSIISRIANMARNAAKAVTTEYAPPQTGETTPPVVVNDIETTVYLDNSPSMKMSTDWFTFASRLEEAKKALHWLSPALGSLPCRVLKFSHEPTVLKPREVNKSVSTCLPQIYSSWDAGGTGTYMWKMIENDVKARYRPGSGKLRLVVVTDGDDNLSPSQYCGMRGMDPMMQTLQQAGYDIEWHIIVVGNQPGLERYKALAGATGGSFLAIDRHFDENASDTKAFRKALHDDGSRRKRQKQYELDAKEGKTDKVEWYKRLPPPKK